MNSLTLCRKRRLTSLFLAFCCIFNVQRASADRVLLLRDPHGSGASLPMCRDLKALMAHPDVIRKSREPLCLWRFDAVPAGFPKFTLPKWKALPASAISREVVDDMWLASGINGARRHGQSDWRHSKGFGGKGVLDDPDLVKHIERVLESGGFELSEAAIDIDFDGHRETVRRLDIKTCDRPFPDLPREIGEGPDYPIYVVLKPDGTIDEMRSFDYAPWQVFLYDGRVRLMSIRDISGDPRNWMRMAARGDGVLGIDVVETAARGAQGKALDPQASDLLVGAAICHLRVDRE